jgi:hypothetical protein
MNQSKKPMFSIEKLIALEWNLKLLNTSVTTTHTPIRTLRSIIRANVVLPTRDMLARAVFSQIWPAIPRFSASGLEFKDAAIFHDEHADALANRRVLADV